LKVSNFEWTDKDSIKWFILMPGGHEGPYSLAKLIDLYEKKKISLDVKLWAEGLTDAILFKNVLERSQELTIQTIEAEQPQETDELPPLPESEEVLPPELPVLKSEGLIKRWKIKIVSLLIFLSFSYVWISKKKDFSIPRLPKMSVELHQKILKENSFESWDKKIFFREYLPLDHSHIWLVTSGHQKCDVEARFNSVGDKLLTYKDEKISFKSRGQLAGHIVEFSSFDFSQGNKIIPGLYEMDVKAENCHWDGFFPKLMNLFSSPEQAYIARIKVILFSKGPSEYNLAIDNLVRKKLALKEKAKNQEQLFWQDLTQKFQTLEAISLQIEQHLLDFLEKEPKNFKKNTKFMMETYSKKFGSFLTSFVVENDHYFKSLEDKGASKKRNYELLVRLTSKKIGFESMKLIEEFLAVKRSLTKKDLNNYSQKVRKKFTALKKEITEKLSQISQDQELED
jgi:hypothetical protein